MHIRASSHALQVRPVLDVANIPSRKATWQRLREATAAAPLDMLVIGGGATGCGTALDAASRCVERFDGVSLLPVASLRMLVTGCATARGAALAAANTCATTSAAAWNACPPFAYAVLLLPQPLQHRQLLRHRHRPWP